MRGAEHASVMERVNSRQGSGESEGNVVTAGETEQVLVGSRAVLARWKEHGQSKHMWLQRALVVVAKMGGQ